MYIKKIKNSKIAEKTGINLSTIINLVKAIKGKSTNDFNLENPQKIININLDEIEHFIVSNDYDQKLKLHYVQHTGRCSHLR